ncbi:hypothetical protein BDZ94DRAFT_1131854, partial [Collybia nuda]
LSLPAPLHSFFSFFPLHTHPSVPLSSKKQFTGPTLWIHPPKEPNSPLSADVECLKWQAYLSLRGLHTLRVRSDVSPDGALDARLPNLQISEVELIAAHLIPSWVDGQLQSVDTHLEGYKDEAARDESRAWVALLEGNVHAALLVSTPPPSYFQTLLRVRSPATDPLQSIVTPPLPPVTGFSSLLPPWGLRISHATIQAQYRDAISALSERLGTDKWFLGSSEPTPLDALAFAYLHSILNSKDQSFRIEVTRRVNLVEWEWRVRDVVRSSF